MAEQKRRLPAIDRTISRVNSNKDKRIALVGRIKNLDKENSICEFEDFTGKIVVIVPNFSIIENIDSEKNYRAVGVVLAHEDGFEIKLESIQKMEDLNLEIYKNYMAASGNA